MTNQKNTPNRFYPSNNRDPNNTRPETPKPPSLKEQAIVRKNHFKEFQTICGGLVRDVATPVVQSLLRDVFYELFESFVFGKTNRQSPSLGRPMGPRRPDLNYPNIYHNPQTRPYNIPHYNAYQSVFDVDSVIFSYYEDAASVLAYMNEMINTYEWVSVLDFLNAAQYPSTPNSEAWGWDNLYATRVVPVEHGKYKIKLPRPKPWN